MGKKALLKESGNIVDVSDEFIVINYLISFKAGTLEVLAYDVKDSPYKEGAYYKINGKEYHQDEVVIGLDNIREYKLKNIEKDLEK